MVRINFEVIVMVSKLLWSILSFSRGSSLGTYAVSEHTHFDDFRNSF